MRSSNPSQQNTLRTSLRTANAAQLAACLQDARDRTITLFDRFAAAGLDQTHRVPPLDILNPPLWELGHIAWFAEWFVLRQAASSAPYDAQKSSLLTMGDDWFDANTVPHAMRWKRDLPSTGALKTYCFEVLDRLMEQLGRAGDDDASLYPYRLVLAYEDMRGEAFVSTLQALGLTLPEGMHDFSGSSWAQGDIRFAGGTITLGSPENKGFIFDNEKLAHPVRVPSFEMDATLISNAQYSDFVEDGGYQNARYWSPAGLAWLGQQARSAPLYWQPEGRSWRVVRFGQLCNLSSAQPVRHVNLYEAQAYCIWADRRLPTEAEWAFAAQSGHPAWRWGDLWEWTCSPFAPFEGFAPDAYREYSVPFFSTHQSVRGASFATPERLRSPQFRHFILPQRGDLLTGFRTCAA